MIITLCGSNRFEEWFKAWNEALTFSGHAVFTTAVYPSFKKGKKEWYTNEQKVILDEVHLKKIDASDAIMLLNPFAYIGESTLREIEYARKKGKIMIALESWGKGYGIGEMHFQSWRDRARAYSVVGFGSPIDTTTLNGFVTPWGTDILGSPRSPLLKILKGFGASAYG